MQTIESYIPIIQAKARLLEMVRRIQDTNDTIAITKNGIPEAVMLSMSKFEGVLETIDALADPEVMLQLSRSAQDLNPNAWSIWMGPFDAVSRPIDRDGQ